MIDLNLAKEILVSEKLTCVIVKGNNVIMTSHEKGVRPLLQYLRDSNEKPQKVFLADKVIGKAAALLAVLADVHTVFADILSEEAKKVLDENNIVVEYNQLVPYIKNRLGTGQCPMENLVADIQEPNMAYQAILDFINQNK
ncbi:DUF1893 domain-containing protein [Vallitalea okinawensis]|uniref:DUF1893 domain-containing protein n=1 Tax=Vallitalea okinawensis TaxID=2078660 RepID=UPI000CFB83E5|nr:DUF1893 domain-containing protein [Vallitalea okinawensis]